MDGVQLCVRAGPRGLRHSIIDAAARPERWPGGAGKGDAGVRGSGGKDRLRSTKNGEWERVSATPGTVILPLSSFISSRPTTMQVSDVTDAAPAPWEL